MTTLAILAPLLAQAAITFVLMLGMVLFAGAEAKFLVTLVDMILLITVPLSPIINEPFTCSLAFGEKVPIPTLPHEG